MTNSKFPGLTAWGKNILYTSSLAFTFEIYHMKLVLGAVVHRANVKEE